MQTIFLTGGSGFVGGWLIRDLRSAGYAVRALARSAAAAEAVRRAGAEPVLGELTDRPLLAAALQGCAAVVHAAASTALWDLSGAAYKANVTGTETLLAAARAAGVPRFVHISTEAVLLDADGAALVGVDEQHPYPQRPTGVYPVTHWPGAGVRPATRRRTWRTASPPAPCTSTWTTWPTTPSWVTGRR